MTLNTTDLESASAVLALLKLQVRLLGQDQITPSGVMYEIEQLIKQYEAERALGDDSEGQGGWQL